MQPIAKIIFWDSQMLSFTIILGHTNDEQQGSLDPRVKTNTTIDWIMKDKN